LSQCYVNQSVWGNGDKKTDIVNKSKWL
jgi:hypothetical protein